MKITTMGLDLAKTVIQTHGVDGHGRFALKRGPSASRGSGFSRPSWRRCPSGKHAGNGFLSQLTFAAYSNR